jgi:hypothetical protein
MLHSRFLALNRLLGLGDSIAPAPRQSVAKQRLNTLDGVLFDVRDTPTARFEISMCQPRCLRIALAGQAILWSKIEADYYGYKLLRRASLTSTAIIAPIPFSLVRRHSVADSGCTHQRWARSYLHMLQRSNASPLRDGQWRLTSYKDGKTLRTIPFETLEKIVLQKSLGYVPWDFGDALYPITLRTMSDADSGRVKAWRKHARAGTLPPILLYWISGLATHVVLDGHDRLLAAYLEKVAAPALSLECVQMQETQPHVKQAVLEQVAAALERAKKAPTAQARAQRSLSVAAANDLLLATFTPQMLLRPSSATFFEGGFEQWQAEVQDELARQGAHIAGFLR